MGYANMVRKLQLSAGFEVPRKLVYEDLTARAINRDDLADDVRGINASIELIHLTRDGTWPTSLVSEDYNFQDLVWHELEFREGSSFTYTAYRLESEYIGCCYLYPMGARSPLTPEVLSFDVDVSWWVMPDAYAGGQYGQLHRALRVWLGGEFPF